MICQSAWITDNDKIQKANIRILKPNLSCYASHLQNMYLVAITHQLVPITMAQFWA